MRTNRKDLFRLSALTGLTSSLKWLIFILVGIYSCFNVVMLVLPTLSRPQSYEPSEDQSETSTLPNWGLPTVVFSVVGFGMAYYFLIFGSAETRYYHFEERYLGRPQHRDRWAVRYKNGYSNPSLDPPSRESVHEAWSSLVPTWLNMLSFSGMKVIVQKEAGYTEAIGQLERIQRYWQRFTIRFVPLHNDAVSFRALS